MTEPATKSRADLHADAVEYENAMREGAAEAKSAALQVAIDRELGEGAFGDPEMRAFLDASTLKALFATELWVFLTLDLVALKISSQPLKVMTGAVINGTFTPKMAEGHPLQDLIENPNPFQSYASWMYCLAVDLGLLGNAILWYASQANYLMLLPGEATSLEIGADNRVGAYVVSEMTSDGANLVRQRATKFAPEDVVHLKRPNPSSLLWGLSPFVPGRRSILFNRYSQEYLNSFYQKGAMPGFALEMGAEANERVAMRLLRTFENAYVGRKNMRRTMMLPKGVTLKEVSHTLANQDLATYIGMNREDIINILKVPKHELSLQEAGSLGSEEARTALKNFWHATLIPMMRIIEGELTRFFRRRGHLTDTNQFVQFDLTNVEALQEDQKTKSELAGLMLKTHTLNEVRKKVYDLPPIEGGDVVQGITAPMPGGFPLLGAVPIQAAPQAALPAPTAAAQEDRDATAIGTKAAKDKLSAFLKGGDGWWSRREAHAREAVAKGVGELEKATLTLFADMAVAIIKTVKSHLKEKGWEAVRTKAE